MKLPGEIRNTRKTEKKHCINISGFLIKIEKNSQCMFQKIFLRDMRYVD